MEQLTAFLQDKWIIIALVVIAILIIVKVIKSVMKWLLIVLLAAGVIIYGTTYSPGEIKDGIKEVGSKIADYTKNEAVEALIGQSASAKYEAKEDGGYVVSAGKFKLEGTAGSNEATLSYMGQSFTIKLDDALNAFIEGAKAAQSGN